MALSYPLSLPAAWKIRRASIRMSSMVGMSESPFTKSQQVFEHQGECWAMDVQLVPMQRAEAEDCIALLAALNGMRGTVLMPPPGNTSGVRGSWAGSPKVNGAYAAGVKSIGMKGFSDAATVKAGDWFQTGSGSTAHLHKVVQDLTIAGSPTGQGTLEFWPRTRVALADNDTLTIVSPMGQWRLASNDRDWDVELAGIFGIRASFIEALEA